MTFTNQFPKHEHRKNFKRSDIEEMNRKSRELRATQENYDDNIRKNLNENKKYVK